MDATQHIKEKDKKYSPALGFLLGGASSSDESSLLDSAAAAFPGAGLTGAYQDKVAFTYYNNH